MSRVVTPPRWHARLTVALTGSLMLGALVATPPIAAQDEPSCLETAAVSDCVLPPWPADSPAQSPSLFGDLPAGSWVTDAVGDAPPGGLDIIAVGIAPIRVKGAASIRKSSDLLKDGAAKKAVRNGNAFLVRIVLDRPPDAIDAGYAGVHVATDADGNRSNNAPTAVGSVDLPFTGLQDVYSLTYATTTDKTKLLVSNLAKGWYKGRSPFAASWAAPTVLDVLLKPKQMGDGFKVVTYVSGPDGGYDTVALGPGLIPVDGRVGLMPTCIEASLSAEPFVIQRLIENGQTLRDVDAPGSWLGGAAIPVDDQTRSALEAFIAANDEDGDGRITLPARASLFESGLITRQRPEVELALVGDAVQLAVQLGLTRRGYSVIRTLAVAPTDDAVVDAYLDRATRAFVGNTPSFRSNKKSGLIDGEAIGACATALISAPQPSPEPSAEAASPSPDTAVPTA